MARSWILKRFLLNTVNSDFFLQGFYFCETSHKGSFVKMKSSRNDEITLSFTDKGKLCPSRDLTSQICFLMLFTKIGFLGKFLNLQYCCVLLWALQQFSWITKKTANFCLKRDPYKFMKRRMFHQNSHCPDSRGITFWMCHTLYIYNVQLSLMNLCIRWTCTSRMFVFRDLFTFVCTV